MKHVDLSHDTLNGQIPEAFSKTMALTYLNLGGNKLKGSVPEIFGNMSALVYLDLGYNMLQGQIPTSIWSRRKLYTSSMDSNSM